MSDDEGDAVVELSPFCIAFKKEKKKKEKKRKKPAAIGTPCIQ